MTDAESKLTDRDKQVLNSLRRKGDQWCRPMDVGGWDASHHSATLAKLYKLGFAERKTYFAWCRNVHKYRAKQG